MTQSVWQVTEIARLAETLCIVNQDTRFQAGVLALAHAVGAPVKLPVLREAAPVGVMIDAANGHEVMR